MPTPSSEEAGLPQPEGNTRRGLWVQPSETLDSSLKILSKK